MEVGGTKGVLADGFILGGGEVGAYYLFNQSKMKRARERSTGLGRFHYFWGRGTGCLLFV